MGISLPLSEDRGLILLLVSVGCAAPARPPTSWRPSVRPGPPAQTCSPFSAAWAFDLVVLLGCEDVLTFIGLSWRFVEHF